VARRETVPCPSLKIHLLFFALFKSASRAFHSSPKSFLFSVKSNVILLRRWRVCAKCEFLFYLVVFRNDCTRTTLSEITKIISFSSHAVVSRRCKLTLTCSGFCEVHAYCVLLIALAALVIALSTSAVSPLALFAS
jgi:hypothetical protein